MLHQVLTVLMAVLPGLGYKGLDTTRICLAPASIEATVGDASAATNAVREAFASYLTGPSLRPQPLTARLESQAREEAHQAGCPYLLLPTLKHVHKRGGGLLGKMASGAAREGAYSAAVSAGSTAGRVGASAAAGAASSALYDYAFSVRSNDELTLGYRLEAGDGSVLVEKQEKRKAKSDGEDLLTPAVQHAAEAVVAAIQRRNH